MHNKLIPTAPPKVKTTNLTTALRNVILYCIIPVINLLGKALCKYYTVI